VCGPLNMRVARPDVIETRATETVGCSRRAPRGAGPRLSAGHAETSPATDAESRLRLNAHRHRDDARGATLRCRRERSHQ
jgi:hypothetical protein